MSHKLYNPKAHAPAVYIPAWLLQISSSLLSNNAKMLYGRLAQWANDRCQVYRSSKQLSEEMGTHTRNIERYLKELRDVRLINTLHPQAGGVNHFEFLHHEWMDEDINKHLVYKSENPIAPTQATIPPDKNVGTPPTKVADINKKEIKVKNTTRGKGAEAPNDDIEALKKHEIKPPKNLTSADKDYLNKAKNLLAENNLTLHEYLDYLTNRCPRALLPYICNGKERRNGFGNLLRPSFITDVLNGKWKD